MSNYKILGLNISGLSYSETSSKIIDLAKNNISAYVCFANVHMTIEAEDDLSFAEIVNNSTIVCADGMPLVKAIKFKYKKSIERVAGMDMMPTIIDLCEKEGLSVFFYGTTNEILLEIQKRITKENPSLKIAGMFSPPFRQLNQIEKEVHIELINKSGANVVFVALGCPKQERWMSENYHKTNSVMLGIGGAFPVYAKLQKRAPEWIRKISMEWLFRFIQDPKRLFKRYLYTNSKFIFLFNRSLLVKQ
jgi:N-acetylglucosaminyldiphosphoundecaprenol N-acetyl-beta-D-mannosaminyltransferase